MRQINIHGVNDLRMDEAPEPAPGPRDVVLKISACGICGTDLSVAKSGGMGGGNPMALGHEAAGVVVAVGADVVGVNPGQRMVINPMSTEAVIGNGGPEGAFCDYLLVREAELGRSLFEIPEGMSPSMAALVEPLSVARHGVNRTEAKAGDKVVVFGAGPIGLGAVVWFRRRGVSKLVVVDLNEARLERAKALGATDVIVAGRGDLGAQVREICGTSHILGGEAADVDAYLDCAGAPSIVSDVVDMAKWRAKLVVIAVHHGPVQIDFGKMLRSELSVTTSIGYPTEMVEVMAELPELSREAEVMISHRFGFDDFFEAFEVARSADCAKVMVEFA